MPPSPELLLAPRPREQKREGERAFPRARPMYLQDELGGSIFAVLHRGAAPTRETVVLLCPPFGWEDMCCYRIRREWAEHLARAGYTTLRIDLPGSGDSAGAPTDPGQLDAWTRAVGGAARWLRRANEDDDIDIDAVGDDRSSSARRVAAIGLGLGGMVSCRAALQGAPIDDLVLWSVPSRGHRLLRELRTFTAFEVANVLEAEESVPAEPVEDGALATNGYLLSAETVAELERLDLREVESRSSAMQRALLLGRDGMKVDKYLPGILESAGATVTVTNGPGYGAMMVEPQDARTPIDVFELVSAWLKEGEPGRTAGESAVAESIAFDVAASDGAALDEAIEVPREQDEMLIEHAGVALRERPVFVDGPSGPLFGVLTEPLAGRRELTGLLLNAGPQRRTGPNRMWVQIARRWAAQGVSTLRLDLAGIGDSEGDPTVLARVAEFYKPAYAEQARAALEMLAERGLPQRFVTLGLCAGSYWSAQAALADERVAAVVMLNPRTLVFDEWRHSVRHTRRVRERLFLRSTWRKVLRGEIKLARHVELARRFVTQAVAAQTRTRKRGAAKGTAGEPIEGLFDALRDRDQRGLMLFTGKEVLRRELTDNGVLDRLKDSWPNLELAILGTSADTHTLTPVWLQRQIHTVIDRVLADELERLPGA
jgi:alpha-beta hydrolase superfamily lysophospholipase